MTDAKSKTDKKDTKANKQAAPFTSKATAKESQTAANKAARIAKAKAAHEAAKTKPDSKGLARMQRRAKVAELKHELAVTIAFDKLEKGKVNHG